LKNPSDPLAGEKPRFEKEDELSGEKAVVVKIPVWRVVKLIKRLFNGPN
jgi:hypothetical protein